MTREQLHYLQLSHRYCYAQPDPPNVHGVGNYVLEILDGLHQPAAALFFWIRGATHRLSICGLDSMTGYAEVRSHGIRKRLIV